MTEFSDSELLEKLRNPDTSHYAFNLLVKKYQQRVYWQVRRIVINHDDANDIVQNVFIKVWKNLSGFKESVKMPISEIELMIRTLTNV